MKIEQEIMEMFDKGYYTFRFEYLDKDNKRRFSINSYNEGMSREDTLKEVYRFVNEHNGKLTDFVENEWVKSFISHIITLVQKREREEMVERIEEIPTPIFDGASGFDYNSGWNDGEKSGQYRLKEEIINLIKTK